MNEKEKKAIELLENIRNNSWTTKYIMSSDSKNAEVLLNLIEKLQKGNEEWNRKFCDLQNLYFKLQDESESKRKEYQETYKDAREELKELKEYLITQNCEINRLNLDKIRLELSQIPDTTEQYKYLKNEYKMRLRRTDLENYKSNYISKQIVKDKIEEIKNIANELSQEIEEELKSEDICREYIRDKKRELGLANRDIKLLQELLEGRK